MKSKKKFAGAKSWIKRHQGDKYVRKANQEGFRSRSRFKLEEIQKSSDLFKRGMTVLDLGSSPGGWSQYAAEIVRPHGCIIACDILPMQPISGVRFLQGDFREESVFEALVALTGEKKFNVVMSDMSPNISGISATDIPRSVHLVQLAFEMCQKTLISGGSFIAKVFQGDNTDDHLKKIRSLFTEVRIRKPDASRSRSREVYIVAVGYKKS